MSPISAQLYPLLHGLLSPAVCLLGGCIYGITFVFMHAFIAAQNRRYNELVAHLEQRFAAIDQRFATIESELEAVKSILAELPEAIRQKIGFNRQ